MIFDCLSSPNEDSNAFLQSRLKSEPLMDVINDKFLTSNQTLCYKIKCIGMDFYTVQTKPLDLKISDSLNYFNPNFPPVTTFAICSVTCLCS